MVTEFGSATDGAEDGGPKLGDVHTPALPPLELPLLEPALALLLVVETVVPLLPLLEPELVPEPELVEPLEVPPLVLVVVLAELELPIELLPGVLVWTVLLPLELNRLLERPVAPLLVPDGGNSSVG